MQHRSRSRGRRLVLSLLWALSACGSPIVATDKPFMAIIPRVRLSPGLVPPSQVTYDVRMLTQPSTVNRRITARPTDTLYLPLPVSTYSVRVAGWPAYCQIDEGDQRTVILFEPNTTSLVRYAVACQPSLVLQYGLEGTPPAQLTLRTVNPRGQERFQTVRPTDTTFFNNLEGGTHWFGLRNLPEACQTLFPGGAAMRPVDVLPSGGARTELRLHCADPARRPILDALAASRTGSTIALTLQGRDPDRNLDRYEFDVTDCNGRSRLSTGARQRNGLLPVQGPSADPSTVITGLELTLPVDTLDRSCVAARLIDRDGNSSRFLSVPLRQSFVPDAPRPVTFDARFINRNQLNITLDVSDPDSDYVGAFVIFRLTDGAINGRLDGQPDVAILNTVGYPLGTPIPPVPAGNGRPEFETYQAVIVLLVDRAGNVTRLEDTNLV